MLNTAKIKIGKAGFRVWGIALSSLFCQASPATPHAWVDQPFWNFGSVTNLTELTHDFVVKNTGDSPLLILRTASSCNACLTVDTKQMEIAPGSSKSIHCRLDLRVLNGPVSRYIAVESNDPKNSAFALGISGVVVPAFKIVPSDVTIDVSRGEQEASANIWPELPMHGALTRVSCDDPNIEAAVSGTGGRFVISARMKTAPRSGDSLAQLTVSSGDSSDPVCRLNVIIHNPADLEWLPGELVFAPQAEEQSRVLWVRQHGTNFLTLLDAVSPSKKFRCEIEPEPFSRNYRIYVSAVGQESATKGSQMLVLKLRNASNQITNLNVPIVVEDQ